MRISVSLSLKPPVFPGAPYPENPGSFPGAPYPQRHLRVYRVMHCRGCSAGQPLPGAAFGQIPSTQAQPAPQTPNVQAQPVQPVPQVTPRPAPNASVRSRRKLIPACRSCLRPADADRDDAVPEWTSPSILRCHSGGFRQLPELTAIGKSSPARDFNSYIKKEPATGAGRTSRPLTATSAQSAVQEAPPASANELLERYIGIF